MVPYIFVSAKLILTKALAALLFYTKQIEGWDTSPEFCFAWSVYKPTCLILIIIQNYNNTHSNVICIEHCELRSVFLYFN